MSKYLMTLTPVDKFFFGGDMTFNVHGDAKHNEKFGTYIIQSAMFPQQTSLLGMLRFLLLRSDESLFDGQSIIPGTSADVADLIGPSSFAVKNGGKDDSCFGKIQKLHRCFVRCKDSDSVHNLDFLGFDHDVCGDAEAGNVGYVNGRKVVLPAIGGYNPKKGYKKVISDETLTKTLNEVFVEDKRIGIQRDIVTGKTNDSSLFKQISYRFNNAAGCTYCFAFYLEAETDMLQFTGQIVSVGADNSQFIIGVEQVAEIPSGNKAGAPHKLVLHSPAYLSREEIGRLASFAFTEVIPFRFLETEVAGTENYSVLPRYKGASKMKSPSRSERYELYAPGSVFYFENAANYNAFVAALESYKGFRQIGYNEY